MTCIPRPISIGERMDMKSPDLFTTPSSGQREKLRVPASPLPTLGVSAGSRKDWRNEKPETGSKMELGVQDGGGHGLHSGHTPPGAEGPFQGTLNLLKKWPLPSQA